MTVKFFPHNDIVSRTYMVDKHPTLVQGYTTSCSKGKIIGGSKLRSLVKGFGGLGTNANYNDANLKTLLTRINRTDEFVVILYGIHTSNSETTPHVTIQMGDGTTDELKKICHFYVKLDKAGTGFVWDSSIEPTWESSIDKWRALNAGQEYS